MSIKYNNKVIAGKYKEQIIPFANTIDAGIAKIATQEEINEGIDNTSIVTPVYLAQKQDKLIAGDGISINEANIISSKITPDKVTIVENENNTISTVARKTVNESIIYDWEGTEAEYHQALMNGEINPDWYCYITDDELSVSYNDVLSRTLINIAPDGEEVIKDLSKESLHDNITNCITELPQRIKLELTNGTLTLKAGSVVIVPNGFEEDGTTLKFDYVTVESDTTFQGVSGQTGSYIVSLNMGDKSIGWHLGANAGSGTETSSKLGFYYRTDLNEIYYQNNNSFPKFCFPFCFVNMSSGVITSIDQVFNGMGYIGSTIWLDKDVKGLYPNGRNEDGSLKNIEITTTKLTTITNPFGATANANSVMGLVVDGTVSVMHRYIESIVEPTTTYTSWYNPTTNKMLYTGATAGEWVEQISMPIASLNWEYVASPKTNTFTSLIPKQPFRAVDYNDYKNDINTLNNITNTLDNTKVNKAGDTMTGNLKIQGGATQHVIQCISNLLMSENPTASTGVGKFQVLDKNGNYLMQAGCERSTDGRNSAFIRAHSPADWSKSVTLQVTYLRDGTYGCNFPKCTTKATTTSSARSDLVAVIVTNYVNGTSWYRVWSDGWIEQGGLTTTNGTTVKFLKAFSNTNYTINMTCTQAVSNYEPPSCIDLTTTSFKATRMDVTSNNGQARWYACGY